VKDEPIRILRLIARLNVGGPAIHVINLTERFSSGRYRTCLACGKVGGHEGDMSYLASEKGVQPLVIESLGREISPRGDMSALGKLRGLIQEFNPHIIHTHTAKAGMLGRLAGISLNSLRSRNRKIKLVHTFHGHVFHSYFGRWKTLSFIQMEKVLARFTQRIVVVSPLQKQDICDRYRIAEPKKVKVIPLGFDLPSCVHDGHAREEWRLKLFPDSTDRTTIVGIVGRLTHVKNHRMLLAAAKVLKETHSAQDFRFLIVGDGELKEALMTLASQSGIDGRVVFSGWQREMASLYSSMDIVALTSLNEGTPVTLIEAMAAAKPVVATAVGGVPDILGAVDRGETDSYKLAERGVLVPPGEADALARALVFMNENKGSVKALADKACEFVLEHYSLGRLVNDCELLYEELMASRG
jgi:glycosyltransferase involved in cell wall biosynthesis